MARIFPLLLSILAASLFPFSLTPDSQWNWPSGSPAQVTRAFDLPEFRWNAGHRGVDLSLPVGSPIYAPGDGVVLYAGQLVDREVLSLRHSGDLRTTFEPVHAIVTVGQTVQRGEQIGVLLEGSSHDGLHWGAKFGADGYIDPLRLLLGPIILKPWE